MEAVLHCSEHLEELKKRVQAKPLRFVEIIQDPLQKEIPQRRVDCSSNMLSLVCCGLLFRKREGKAGKDYKTAVVIYCHFHSFPLD